MLMQLFKEYAPPHLTAQQAWAQLTLPDIDLPEITAALKKFIHQPQNFGRNTLHSDLLHAANQAAMYFDQNVCPTEQRRKFKTRYARLLESVENNDGTINFIKNGNNFLGYIRVMAVSTQQWEDYYDRKKISEAEFIAKHPMNLETGQAHIFVQAIVFPEFKEIGIRNKVALQEAAIASMIGNMLPKEIPNEGINTYLTAFHAYTNKFAKRLRIPNVGENKTGAPIYGFNISRHAPEMSLGSEIYKRWRLGKKAHTPSIWEFQQPQAHPPAHSPDAPRDLSPNEM